MIPGLMVAFNHATTHPGRPVALFYGLGVCCWGFPQVVLFLLLKLEEGGKEVVF